MSLVGCLKYKASTPRVILATSEVIPATCFGHNYHFCISLRRPFLRPYHDLDDASEHIPEEDVATQPEEDVATQPEEDVATQLEEAVPTQPEEPQSGAHIPTV